MRFFSSLTFSVVLLLTFFVSAQNIVESTPKKKTIDKLEYKLKLGWFTIGKGQISIDYNATTVDGKVCDEVHMHTETGGLANWLGNLDDDYYTTLDASTSKTINNNKNVTNGKSRWEQWADFDYDRQKIDVKVLDHKRENPNRNWEVELTNNTFDVLGTYMYLKNMDWKTVKKGDSVMLDTFYEKKLYYVGVSYQGEERIEFDDKEMLCDVLHLILPHNDKLKSDNPVKIWISKTQPKVPLRVQTKVPFLGKGRVELIRYNDKEFD